MADTRQDHLRKLWRKHHMACAAMSKEWAERGYQHPPPAFPPLPYELSGLTCGEKTRAGSPCKRRDLYISGRCKLHGGMPTGPKGDCQSPEAGSLET